MATQDVTRTLAGATVGAIGVAAALVAGAPLVAALLGVLAGVAAAALAWPSAPARAVEPVRPPSPGTAETPDLRPVLDAVDEPLLILRDRRVIAANAAARTVLGEHIEGVDVRLAIRHPAAAEKLGEAASDEASTASDGIELVGLGELDRRWRMSSVALGDGTRVVRLADTSQAHAAEQMRVDFVANASHELRTPLATILGFIETLQDDGPSGPDPATRARFLGIMFDEARRIRRLVDDLMSLSRIEAERFRLPTEAVDLMGVVEEVRAGCSQILEGHGGELRVERRFDDTVVPGDRPQLVQMLQNLVSNALRYGRQGTPVTVRFEAAEPDMLLLSVVDEGDGIAPEHLPRLTERFYRADPGRSRALGGTGLGLAIVKHIVQRHRGRLDIQSVQGQGTTVRVLLPRAARS